MPTRNKEISIGALRSFAAVAQFGSANSAAERTGVNPSTIWSQLGALEKYFQCDLLDRSGGKLKPTHNGRLLLSYAAQALEAVDEAHQQIAKSLPSTQLRLRADVNIPRFLLIETLEGLESISPDTQTEVSQHVDLYESGDQPATVDVDLALRGIPQTPGRVSGRQDSSEWNAIRDLPLIWAVAKQSSDNCTVPRLIRRRATGAMNQAENIAIQSLNGPHSVVSWCDSSTVLIEMVKSGLGTGLLCQATVEQESDLLKPAPFAGKLPNARVELVARFPNVRRNGQLSSVVTDRLSSAFTGAQQGF